MSDFDAPQPAAEVGSAFPTPGRVVRPLPEGVALHGMYKSSAPPATRPGSPTTGALAFELVRLGLRLPASDGLRTEVARLVTIDTAARDARWHADAKALLDGARTSATSAEHAVRVREQVEALQRETAGAA